MGCSARDRARHAHRHCNGNFHCDSNTLERLVYSLKTQPYYATSTDTVALFESSHSTSTALWTVNMFTWPAVAGGKHQLAFIAAGRNSGVTALFHVTTVHVPGTTYAHM